MECGKYPRHERPEEAEQFDDGVLFDKAKFKTIEKIVESESERKVL